MIVRWLGQEKTIEESVIELPPEGNLPGPGVPPSVKQFSELEKEQDPIKLRQAPGERTVAASSQKKKKKSSNAGLFAVAGIILVGIVVAVNS